MEGTMAEAKKIRRVPVLPPYTAPPIYNTRGSASDFIKEYEWTSIKNGWDSKLKMSYFGRFLEGYANLWYKLYIEDKQNGRKTWDNIKEDFLTEFEDTEVKTTLVPVVVSQQKQKMTCSLNSGKYSQQHGVEFEEDEFGLFTDKLTGESSPVRRFTWRNSNGIFVQVITYGATITSIKLPDKNGTVDDIVMGFDDMKGYLNPLNPYFGATVGRVANRIGYAKITIDDVTYNVSANLGQHTLHGGFKGFDKVNWNYYIDGTKVVLSYLSKDNEEGFPGDVITNVTYELTNDNQFKVDFKSTTTKATYVNLTNHSYFNLAGHAKGAEEVYKHKVSINADYTTEVDGNSIPSGKLLPVADTVFDLRIPIVLGDVIHKIPGYLGYDHNFCVNKASEQENTFVARAVHPPSGRAMEIYSNQPGVQFYTANHIPENPNDFKGDGNDLQTLTGKKGQRYYKHGSFCFETQNYPDAINHKSFPPATLYPGNTYHHTVVYKFFVN